MSILEIFRRVVTYLSGTKVNVQESINVNTGNISAKGNVHIGDIISPQTDIPKYITNKPFNPEIVLGRTNDIDVINQEFWNGSKKLLLLVNGEGGIGKTTLAARYWINNENVYEHLGWLYAGNGIQSAFLSMAEGLGRSFDSKMSNNDRIELFCNIYLILKHLVC